MNDDDAEKLKSLLADPECGVDAAWVEEMKARYPFFTLPQCIALREKSADMTAAEMEASAAPLALSLSSTDALERIVEPDGERLDKLYPKPQAPATPSTNNAIDRFLETYGGADAAETEILEKMIFNPVADYSQQLARQEGDTVIPDPAPSGDSQTDRINRFILSVRGKESIRKDESPAVQSPAEEPEKVVQPKKQSRAQAPAVTPPAPDNSLLSESLAKIYIKTRRYERAYEILNRLSLSFPEKNAYFADQLRFLRKLMLAESCRNKRDSENNHPE